MTPEKILSRPAKVLQQAQRERFFEDGYLALPSFVAKDWMDRLHAATEAMIDASRSHAKSDEMFDLETGHSAETPRLRRLTQPVEHHPDYWEFASQGPILDVAEDLLGPNIKFHHTKLNFKAPDGGVEVKWHQDIPFLPHTNYSVLTIGVYLNDVDEDNAPMGVIPGSHKGELFNLYNDKDQWTGAINKSDLGRIGAERAVYLTGPAGSITVHSCRTLHGSGVNRSPRPRPLLLHMYSSADALPITPNPMHSRYNGAIVRGRRARWAEFDPRPCLMPPDWSGHQSLFAHQYQ
jgi:ectoine hydroxylase-related dioxygenase (phytanoyl-CoA dioxygenase family)